MVTSLLSTMQIAHLPANKAHQEWMLNKVLELIKPGNKGVQKGELKETDFLKATYILENQNRIRQKYTFTEFYQPLLK